MKLFKIALLCLPLAFCLYVATLLWWRYSGPQSMSLSTVALHASGESSVSLVVPKGRYEPWRFRFWSDARPLTGPPSPADHFAVYLRNDDTAPVEMLVDGYVTVAPGASVKIFEGTFEGLCLVGRTSREELTLKTSEKRRVPVTLTFKHDPRYYRGVEIDVSIWFLHYGM